MLLVVCHGVDRVVGCRGVLKVVEGWVQLSMVMTRGNL